MSNENKKIVLVTPPKLHCELAALYLQSLGLDVTVVRPLATAVGTLPQFLNRQDTSQSAPDLVMAPTDWSYEATDGVTAGEPGTFVDLAVPVTNREGVAFLQLLQQQGFPVLLLNTDPDSAYPAAGNTTHIPEVDFDMAQLSRTVNTLLARL